jgi:predicted RNase H-like nuclease
MPSREGSAVKPRFLGLDLAWMPTNRSGLAVVDETGRLLSVRSDLRGDDDVLAWIVDNLGGCGAVAIDMPTIVRNLTGQRDCEGELGAEFRGQHAAPYPANLGLAPFAGGGRASRLIARLGERVVHTTAIAAADPRTVAFETYPHAAAVRLFGLDTILKYKKKQRPWPSVLSEWTRYRALLDSLRDADPPLLLDETLLPRSVGQAGYKHWDDTIDAVLCAYVAAFVWTHGTRSAAVRVYGGTDGHIIVPAGPPVKRAPGGYTTTAEPANRARQFELGRTVL